MQSSQTPDFAGEKNIAVKIPRHAYEATVRFYRDVLGLPLLGHWISDPAGNVLLVSQAGVDSTLIPPSES
jgi:catechol 2,3-dioxygenase-like lactoylglutathione lyase family enzyme